MKRLITFLALALFFFLPIQVFAQTSSLPGSYIITDFKSSITLEKDTSLLIKESILVNFPTAKHGIYRIIPVYYVSQGRTINSRLKVMSVTDEQGSSYKYSQSRLKQSISLKIGDPDKTITGVHTYVISYKVFNVVKRYPEEDEIYWNVTGSEWDTDIASASALVDSPYAEITRVECFAGQAGSDEKFCGSDFDDSTAAFNSTQRLGEGRDFTVVIGLNNQNQLVFPGKFEEILQTGLDNLGYLLAVLPLAVLFGFWYKKGRDKKYAGDNVYYRPDDKKVVIKPLFAREHLPMVYSPIAGLTPAQVGTIVDEKVDIADVVSEIVELARMGYLKIEKIQKKALIGSKTDYSFIKLDKESEVLADYQKYLLEKLFAKETKLNSSGQEYVFLSSLKNHFYEYLNDFRKKLYKNLAEKGFFDGNPDMVRKKWVGVAAVLYVLAFVFLSIFNSPTGNFGPTAIFFVTAFPAIFLVKSMPRKTAWGYSLYRQTKGLAFYLGKGKWREEVNEKHLFLEEMLPLAIALGVVDSLAKDMQELGVAPPSYFQGFVAGSFYSDITGFSKSTSSGLISAPGGSWSGASSWSGGSGFGGGGFSGGGFGGGGGGSW